MDESGRVGNENGLRLRIYGETGGLEWSQEAPNHLRFARFGEPTQLITRGGAAADPLLRLRRAFRPVIPRATSKPSRRSIATSPN